MARRSGERARARASSSSRDDALSTLRTARGHAALEIDGRRLELSNLDKPFWPELGLAKRDLLQYYADVSPALLPHVVERAMVMKRYPNGWSGASFFMKRTPAHAPSWLRTCSIRHASESVIAFPVVDDLAALLWIVNLGCIDLNPWYARCDDVDRPDFLHFDLDPPKTKAVDYGRVREAALAVRAGLTELGLESWAKTTGSRGMHVYVPIRRGPTQKQVWTVAKVFARALAARHPRLLTAEYRVAKRPPRRVLVDYNQNAWGRTLASVYSVRPTPRATVSAPVTWAEVEGGITTDDFHLGNMRARLDDVGDLWAELNDRTRGHALDDLIRAAGTLAR